MLSTHTSLQFFVSTSFSHRGAATLRFPSSFIPRRMDDSQCTHPSTEQERHLNAFFFPFFISWLFFRTREACKVSENDGLMMYDGFSFFFFAFLKYKHNPFFPVYCHFLYFYYFYYHPWGCKFDLSNTKRRQHRYKPQSLRRTYNGYLLLVLPRTTTKSFLTTGSPSSRFWGKTEAYWAQSFLFFCIWWCMF